MIKTDIESGTVKTSNKSTNKSSDKSTDSEGCLIVCGVCVSGILILGMIAGIIAYLVFGIMYLVQDYDLAKDCSESSLWAYVLTAIILAFLRCSAKDNSKEKDDFIGTIFKLICLGMVETGLAIWGGIELWQKSCDDLMNSNLWKFGLATFCLQTICASIFVLIIPLVFLFSTICKK